MPDGCSATRRPSPCSSRPSGCSSPRQASRTRGSSRRGGAWPGCIAPSTDPIAPRSTNRRGTSLSRGYRHAGPVSWSGRANRHTCTRRVGHTLRAVRFGVCCGAASTAARHRDRHSRRDDERQRRLGDHIQSDGRTSGHQRKRQSRCGCVHQKRGAFGRPCRPAARPAGSLPCRGSRRANDHHFAGTPERSGALSRRVRRGGTPLKRAADR
jgi:hypothetical protein